MKTHALVDLSWNGEYGEESSSTATCRCGWQESASSQKECRFEYQEHLRSEARKKLTLHKGVGYDKLAPARDEGQTVPGGNPERWSRED